MSTSLNLTQAANAAGQFLFAIDSGGSLSTQQLTDALAVANDLLASWTNEQIAAINILISEQLRAGQVFIDQQAAAAFPLVLAYTLAGGTYIGPNYTTPSCTFGTPPQFADLTTPITIPNGIARALKLALAVELAPQYATAPSAALLKDLAEARAAANPMPGRIPTPGMDTVPAPPPPA